MSDVGACRACGEQVPAAASFCPTCGAALGPSRDVEPGPDPDATVVAALPPVSEAIGHYAGDKFGGAMDRLRELLPRRRNVDNRIAGIIGLLGGLLAVAATYLPWIHIEIAGRSGPGSLATGLGGRDGLTVLVVGALAAVIGGLLLMGRGDAWLKMGLFVTGGIVTIIGIVDTVDVHDKAEALERRFGIAEGVVTASAGIGLWTVLGAGVLLLVAGLLSRRAVASMETVTPEGEPAAPEPEPERGQLSRIT